MAQTQKGKVTFLNGTAISKDSNGRDRLLKVTDVVFSGDTINMGDIEGTKAVILMENGREYVLVAGDVVRLRGESPVNENFDAAAVLKALLEQDAQRTERINQEYHSDRSKFSQSGKKVDISTNIADMHTNSGGDSSGRVHGDDENTMIKTGHYTQITHSIDDVNKNILEIFNYQAGEKNNIKTNSIASTTPAIKQSSQAPIQENQVEPTSPNIITAQEFQATSIRFKITDPSLERFDLGVSKNRATHLEIGTSGDGDEVVVVYAKDAQNAIKKVSSLIQDGTNSQEIVLLDTDLSLGNNKIVAFTSTGDLATDMANARLIFANDRITTKISKATSVRELTIADVPQGVSYDTAQSKSEISINLPSLNTNKALDKIIINFKTPKDTADSSHEIVLTPNATRSSWSLDSLSKIDSSLGTKTAVNFPFSLGADKISLPYDELSKSSISATVKDIFFAESGSSVFDLASNAISASLQFYSDEKVENGVSKQDTQAQETLISSDKTTDSSLKLKLNLTGDVGGNELIIYKKSGSNAPDIAGKIPITQGTNSYEMSINLNAQNDGYKFIAIVHDSGKSMPSADFVNSAFSGTNGASTVASTEYNITVLPIPTAPEIDTNTTDKKVYISLSDEPFVNALKISYQDTSGAAQIAQATKSNGAWSINGAQSNFIINGSKLEMSYENINIKAPIQAENLNELGVKSQTNSTFVSVDNIDKFIDTHSNKTLDTLKSENGNYISSDTTPTIRLKSKWGDIVAIYRKDEVSEKIELADVVEIKGVTSPRDPNSQDVSLAGLEIGHNYKFIALNVPIDGVSTTVENFKNDSSLASLRDELLSKASEYMADNKEGTQSLHVQLKQLIAKDERASKFDASNGISFDATLTEGKIKVYAKGSDGNIEPISRSALDITGSNAFVIQTNDTARKSTTIISSDDKIGAANYGLKGYVYGLNDTDGALFTNINGGKTRIESSLGSESNKFSIASNSSSLYLKTGSELNLDYFSDNGASKIATMGDDAFSAKLKQQGGMFEFIGTDFSSLSNKSPEVIAIQQKGSVSTHLSGGVDAPEYVYLHYAKSGKSVNILKINDNMRLEVFSQDGKAVSRASNNSNQDLSEVTHTDDGSGTVKFKIGKILQNNTTTNFELTRAISKDALTDEGNGVLDMSVSFGDENAQIVSLGDSAGGVDMRAIFSTSYETKGGVNTEVSDTTQYANTNKLNSILYYDGPENDGLLSSSSGKIGGLYVSNSSTSSSFSASEGMVITGRKNQQDNITGSSDDDVIDGGGGISASLFDTIGSGGGDDTIIFRENSKIDAGGGSDTLVLLPNEHSTFGAQKISNIETISLGDYAGVNNGGNYKFKLGDIFEADKTITIKGDAKDHLSIIKNQTSTTYQVSEKTDSQDYHRYTVTNTSTSKSMLLDIDKDIISEII